MNFSRNSTLRPNRLQQRLFSVLNRVPTSTIEILAYKIAYKIRRWTADDNKLIEYSLNGKTLFFPSTHDGPLFYSKYPKYSDCIRQASICLGRTRGCCPVIDIGANIGDSAILIKTDFSHHLLLIDGNQSFLELARENLKEWSDLTILCAILDEGVEDRLLTMSSALGTGSAQTTSSPFESTAAISLDQLLSNVPEFSQPGIIKIDTDGFDLAILLGATQTIGRCCPIIVFEFYPQLTTDWSSLWTRFYPHLEAAGYREFVAWHNSGDLAFRTSNFGELIRYGHELLPTKRYLDVVLVPHWVDSSYAWT